MMFLNLPSGNQTWPVLICFTENINYKWLMFKYQRVKHKKHNIWFQIQKKKNIALKRMLALMVYMLGTSTLNNSE